jgi:hypothetical protein
MKKLTPKFVLPILLISVLILTSCGSSTKAPTPKPTPTVSSVAMAVPQDCLKTKMLDALRTAVPNAQYIPTKWQPAPGTELADVLGNGGIACSYGLQSEAIGLTVRWVSNSKMLFEANEPKWFADGYQVIDIPNLNETKAYFRQRDQSGTQEFSIYSINYLINGNWISLNSTFGKTIADGAAWISAATASLI